LITPSSAKRADEPGDVHGAALGRVVRLPHDCFIVVRDLALLIRLALIRLRAYITFVEHMPFS
jgi:hypothetical protein